MTDFQDIKINGFDNQIKYPLDYVSQEVIRTILNSVYPLGSIFTTVNPIPPNVQFGFGTWTAFGAGRVMVGYDSGQTEFDTIEETGGAKTHTLSISEMPAHTHSSVVTTNGGGPNNLAGGGGFNTAGSTDSTGGGGSHNNLQPYVVVYFWKRTA